jgi:phosphopantothenoylcysteine decarboxylase/phosphopantothenate--cysteine ligase
MKKNILIGITGGIAAYKACSLVTSLLKEGHDVKVIMTDSATKFVSPLTFQALTNHAVYTDMWNIQNPEEVEHISLAKWADVIVIAPATANTISKMVHGLADNLLTTVTLATPQKTPIIIAPAMNTQMWLNPITQGNIKKLEAMEKYRIINPREGKLACRDEGAGKIADIETILSEIKKVFHD